MFEQGTFPKFGSFDTECPYSEVTDIRDFGIGHQDLQKHGHRDTFHHLIHPYG